MKALTVALIWLVCLLSSNTAIAVPSFARQTGMACEACHSSYPELTQFGRHFKLNGYVTTGITQVETAGNDKNPGLKINQIPPLSLMLQATMASLKGTPLDTTASTPGTKVEKTSSGFPQQLSLFFAGEISANMGSMIQLTYTHADDHFSIDNSDIRYANHTTLAGKDTIYGLTLNNNPTVEDPWQSTPAWGFPFITANIQPTPIAATQIDGSLAQDVFGAGPYALWGEHWYGNLSGYRSEHAGVTPPNNSTAQHTISGVAPYWRLAYQTNFGDNYLEAGTYGILAHIVPTGVVGDSDKYRDIALDAQYERALGGNSLVIRSTYIREDINWDSSFPAGASSNTSDRLNTWHLNGSYHFGGHETLTLGYVNTSGSSNALRYAAAANIGSANGKPDTRSWQAQFAYLLWQNVQLGLQYTAFTRFNGGTSNYDGFGRKASDNNTAMAYAWFIW